MRPAASSVSQLHCFFFPSIRQILFQAVYYTCVFCVFEVVINLQNPFDKRNEIITWKRFTQPVWERCIKPWRG